MSVDATRWAWMQGAVKGTDKLVLLALADRADEGHRCWPSTARLESDTGLYRETIHASIERLEAAGLLVVTRRNGAGNRYALVGVEGREDRTPKREGVNRQKRSANTDRSANADQSANADSNQSANAARTSRQMPTVNLKGNLKGNLTIFGAASAALPADAAGHPGEPDRGDPADSGKDPGSASLTESLTAMREGRAVALMCESLPGLSAEVAAEYRAHRRAQKFPLTVAAWNRIAAEVKKADGFTPDAALLEAIDAGWRGLKAGWLANRRRPANGSPGRPGDRPRLSESTTGHRAPGEGVVNQI